MFNNQSKYFIFLSISGIINGIFKFCVIGIIIAPYFLSIENLNTKVCILQIISSIGIGLGGLYDICTCCTLEESEKKRNNTSVGFFPSCLFFLIYSTPSVTVFWLSHLVNKGEINDNGISLWIILSFFSTMFFNLGFLFMYFLLLFFLSCFNIKKEVVSVNTIPETHQIYRNRSSTEIILK